MTSTILSTNPLIRLTSTPRFRAKSRWKSAAISARLDDSKNSANQQLNLSVLRFTLGISLSPSLCKWVLSEGICEFGDFGRIEFLFVSVTFRCDMGFRDSWVG